MIKSQLAKAGIDVTLKEEDQNTYYGTGDNQPWLDVPMGIVDWAPRGFPSQLITPAYTSKNIPPGSGHWNSAHWANKTFDRLLSDSDKQTNKAKYNADVFKAAHVPHAKWVHPSEYDAKELPADKNATPIFYCHNEH